MPINEIHQVSLELWSRVFDQLSVTDIFRLSRTCHRLHEFTESYWHSMISLSRILKPFISLDEDVDGFREMMHKTGAIISGSSALQAFARVHYDGSDLDLYVHETKEADVNSFLKFLGYRTSESNIATKEGLDPDDGYPGKTEIIRVATYIRYPSYRVIQVIYTTNAPVLAVLQFHSTCVMNFITDSKAYSLYPYNTLCEKKTLVCGPTTTKIVDALKKYEDRGWTVLMNMTIDGLILNPTSEINTKYRRTDDAFCWTRQLKSGNGICRGPASSIGSNFKWRISFQKFRLYDDILEGLTRPIEWRFSGRLEVSDD